MPSLAMQRTAVIDPFQAYTGIAPPALLETDPLAYPDEMPMAEGGVTGYQEGGEPQIDPLILETEQKDESNGLDNFGIDEIEESTPDLFNSDENVEEKFTSFEDNEKTKEEEDDLEIPAFLRRQKN